MRTITLSTENSETYSSISNFFIDYYMTEANGEFVKVYLYLIRLLNGSRQISVAGVADHFNLTEKDICRAIKYWVAKGVLRLTYDGKGQPTGIVILPLAAPEVELSSDADAVSMLRLDAPAQEAEPVAQPPRSRSSAGRRTRDNRTHEVSVSADASAGVPVPKIVPLKSSNVELSAPQKPAFTQNDIDRLMRDEDWEDILYQVETLFEKPISQSDTQSLLYIYDTLGFSVELFEYLIEYCTTMKKKNCRYLEATAIGWYQDGIRTKAQAREQYVLMSSICRVFYRALGIHRSTPTTIEQEFFKTWSKDYGFNEALVEEACRRAVLHVPNPTIKYVDGILTKWHNAGVKDFDDIKKLDQIHEEEKKAAKPKTPQKKNSFTDFTQTDLSSELDEMEQLFHKEVNSQ